MGQRLAYSVTPEDRAKTIRTAMGMGMSRADANIMVDLAVHATNEALAAIERVAATAPEAAYISVTANALLTIGQLGAAFIEAAPANGVKVHDHRKDIT